MRKLSLAEWERKYIVGPVERFDQKYTMFNRPVWDPEVTGRLDDWSFAGEARERPGYSPWEHALNRASSRATQLSLFNVHKPNPSAATTALMAAMGRGQRQSRPAAPSGNGHHADVSDAVAVTRNVKKAARYFGADLVGVCRLDRRWVYSNSYEGRTFEDSAASGETSGASRPQDIPEEFQYAVVMGFDMDYEMMRRYPSYIADSVTGMGYSRMAIANAHLAAFIRGLGFKTIDCSINDVALSVPLALLAGLGDLGRNGLLVTPELGPRLRLSKVLTDMPMEPDAPVDFGVTEFCQSCRKCADLCPSQAISSGQRTTEPQSTSNAAGEMKWPVHAEKCRMYWSRMKKSCCNCIACCPYSKPDTLFHRTVRRLTDHARWADRLYIRADSLFGYGRPVKAQDFWEDWQPRRKQPRLVP